MRRDQDRLGSRVVLQLDREMFQPDVPVLWRRPCEI
jgi:hypothetical protein